LTRVLLLFQRRLVILNLARGQVDPGLKIGRVDLEKQVSLVQLLVVLDRNVNDRTRHPRGDPDDIGSDLPIPGPGILDVSVVERASRPSRQANHD
jgi:hypothetical protein